MNEIIDLLAQNKITIGTVLATILLLWNKIVAYSTIILSKIKLSISGTPKSNTSAPSDSDVEQLDQQAIKHLRDRSAKMGDAELVAMIKDISNKFYDIHIESVMKTSSGEK